MKEEDDNILVVSSDSDGDGSTTWTRKCKNKQFQRLFEKVQPILFHYVLPEYTSSYFPYGKFKELAEDLRKSLKLVNVKSTKAFIWKNLIRWLISMKLCYDGISDLKYDERYNLILTDFMAQYMSYKCNLYSTITDETEVCRRVDEILITLGLVFSGNTTSILMTLMKIEVKDVHRVILDPIFRKYLSDRHIYEHGDLISYLRLILCYRQWKKLAHLKEDKELINEIAVGKSEKTLRSGARSGNVDLTGKEGVLPKMVPEANETNRPFAVIAGLIGFAMRNKAYGTRILLINKSLDLEETIVKYFQQYEKYICRSDSTLCESTRALRIFNDIWDSSGCSSPIPQPMIIDDDDLKRSPSRNQCLPEDVVAPVNRSENEEQDQQELQNEEPIDKQGNVSEHLSMDCDISNLSKTLNSSSLSSNKKQLSRRFKKKPQNRNSDLYLRRTHNKKGIVIEVDSTDDENDENCDVDDDDSVFEDVKDTNKSIADKSVTHADVNDMKNTVPCEKQTDESVALLPYIEKLRQRAIAVGDCLNSDRPGPSGLSVVRSRVSPIFLTSSDDDDDFFFENDENKNPDRERDDKDTTNPAPCENQAENIPNRSNDDTVNSVSCEKPTVKPRSNPQASRTGKRQQRALGNNSNRGAADPSNPRRRSSPIVLLSSSDDDEMIALDVPASRPERPTRKEKTQCITGEVSSTTLLDFSNTPDAERAAVSEAATLENAREVGTLSAVRTPLRSDSVLANTDYSDVSDDDSGPSSLAGNRLISQLRWSKFSKVVEEATSSTSEIPTRAGGEISTGNVIFSIHPLRTRRSTSSSPCPTRTTSPTDSCPKISPSSTIRTGSTRPNSRNRLQVTSASRITVRRFNSLVGASNESEIATGALSFDDDLGEKSQESQQKLESAKEDREVPTCSRYVVCLPRRQSTENNAKEKAGLSSQRIKSATDSEMATCPRYVVSTALSESSENNAKTKKKKPIEEAGPSNQRLETCLEPAVDSEVAKCSRFAKNVAPAASNENDERGDPKEDSGLSALRVEPKKNGDCTVVVPPESSAIQAEVIKTTNKSKKDTEPLMAECSEDEECLSTDESDKNAELNKFLHDISILIGEPVEEYSFQMPESVSKETNFESAKPTEKDTTSETQNDTSSERLLLNKYIEKPSIAEDPETSKSFAEELDPRNSTSKISFDATESDISSEPKNDPNSARSLLRGDAEAPSISEHSSTATDPFVKQMHPRKSRSIISQQSEQLTALESPETIISNNHTHFSKQQSNEKRTEDVTSEIPKSKEQSNQGSTIAKKLSAKSELKQDESQMTNILEHVSVEAELKDAKHRKFDSSKDDHNNDYNLQVQSTEILNKLNDLPSIDFLNVPISHNDGNNVSADDENLKRFERISPFRDISRATSEADLLTSPLEEEESNEVEIESPEYEPISPKISDETNVLQETTSKSITPKAVGESRQDNINPKIVVTPTTDGAVIEDGISRDQLLESYHNTTENRSSEKISKNQTENVNIEDNSIENFNSKNKNISNVLIENCAENIEDRRNDSGPINITNSYVMPEDKSGPNNKDLSNEIIEDCSNAIGPNKSTSDLLLEYNEVMIEDCSNDSGPISEHHAYSRIDNYWDCIERNNKKLSEVLLDDASNHSGPLGNPPDENYQRIENNSMPRHFSDNQAFHKHEHALPERYYCENIIKEEEIEHDIEVELYKDREPANLTRINVNEMWSVWQNRNPTEGQNHVENRSVLEDQFAVEAADRDIGSSAIDEQSYEYVSKGATCEHKVIMPNAHTPKQTLSSEDNSQCTTKGNKHVELFSKQEINEQINTQNIIQIAEASANKTITEKETINTQNTSKIEAYNVKDVEKDVTESVPEQAVKTKGTEEQIQKLKTFGNFIETGNIVNVPKMGTSIKCRPVSDIMNIPDPPMIDKKANSHMENNFLDKLAIYESLEATTNDINEKSSLSLPDVFVEDAISQTNQIVSNATSIEEIIHDIPKIKESTGKSCVSTYAMESISPDKTIIFDYTARPVKEKEAVKANKENSSNIIATSSNMLSDKPTGNKSAELQTIVVVQAQEFPRASEDIQAFAISRVTSEEENYDRQLIIPNNLPLDPCGTCQKEQEIVRSIPELSCPDKCITISKPTSKAQISDEFEKNTWPTGSELPIIMNLRRTEVLSTEEDSKDSNLSTVVQVHADDLGDVNLTFGSGDNSPAYGFETSNEKSAYVAEDQEVSTITCQGCESLTGNSYQEDCGTPVLDEKDSDGVESPTTTKISSLSILKELPELPLVTSNTPEIPTGSVIIENFPNLETFQLHQSGEKRDIQTTPTTPTTTKSRFVQPSPKPNPSTETDSEYQRIPLKVRIKRRVSQCADIIEEFKSGPTEPVKLVDISKAQVMTNDEKITETMPASCNVPLNLIVRSDSKTESVNENIPLMTKSHKDPLSAEKEDQNRCYQESWLKKLGISKTNHKSAVTPLAKSDETVTTPQEDVTTKQQDVIPLENTPVTSKNEGRRRKPTRVKKLTEQSEAVADDSSTECHSIRNSAASQPIVYQPQVAKMQSELTSQAALPMVAQSYNPEIIAATILSGMLRKSHKVDKAPPVEPEKTIKSRKASKQKTKKQAPAAFTRLTRSTSQMIEKIPNSETAVTPLAISMKSTTKKESNSSANKKRALSSSSSETIWQQEKTREILRSFTTTSECVPKTVDVDEQAKNITENRIEQPSVHSKCPASSDDEGKLVIDLAPKHKCKGKATRNNRKKGTGRRKIALEEKVTELLHKAEMKEETSPSKVQFNERTVLSPNLVYPLTDEVDMYLSGSQRQEASNTTANRDDITISPTKRVQKSSHVELSMLYPAVQLTEDVEFTPKKQSKTKQGPKQTSTKARGRPVGRRVYDFSRQEKSEDVIDVKPAVNTRATSKSKQVANSNTTLVATELKPTAEASVDKPSPSKSIGDSQSQARPKERLSFSIDAILGNAIDSPQAFQENPPSEIEKEKAELSTSPPITMNQEMWLTSFSLRKASKSLDEVVKELSTSKSLIVPLSPLPTSKVTNKMSADTPILLQDLKDSLSSTESFTLSKVKSRRKSMITSKTKSLSTEFIHSKSVNSEVDILKIKEELRQLQPIKNRRKSLRSTVKIVNAEPTDNIEENEDNIHLQVQKSEEKLEATKVSKVSEEAEEQPKETSVPKATTKPTETIQKALAEDDLQCKNTTHGVDSDTIPKETHKKPKELPESKTPSKPAVYQLRKTVEGSLRCKDTTKSEETVEVPEKTKNHLNETTEPEVSTKPIASKVNKLVDCSVTTLEGVQEKTTEFKATLKPKKNKSVDNYVKASEEEAKGTLESKATTKNMAHKKNKLVDSSVMTKENEQNESKAPAKPVAHKKKSIDSVISPDEAPKEMTESKATIKSAVRKKSKSVDRSVTTPEALEKETIEPKITTKPTVHKKNKSVNSTATTPEEAQKETTKPKVTTRPAAYKKDKSVDSSVATLEDKQGESKATIRLAAQKKKSIDSVILPDEEHKETTESKATTKSAVRKKSKSVDRSVWVIEEEQKEKLESAGLYSSTTTEENNQNNSIATIKLTMHKKELVDSSVTAPEGGRKEKTEWKVTTKPAAHKNKRSVDSSVTTLEEVQKGTIEPKVTAKVAKSKKTAMTNAAVHKENKFIGSTVTTPETKSIEETSEIKAKILPALVKRTKLVNNEDDTLKPEAETLERKASIKLPSLKLRISVKDALKCKSVPRNENPVKIAEKPKKQQKETGKKSKQNKSLLKYLEVPHNADTKETNEHLKETSSEPVHPTQVKRDKSQEKLLKTADSADTVRQSEEIPFQSSESKVSLSMAKSTPTKRNKSQKKLLKFTDSADVVQGEDGAIQTSDSTEPLLSTKPMAAKREKSQEELLKTTDSVEIVFQPEECPIQTSESKASLSLAKPKGAKRGKSQEELLKTTDGCAETVVQPEEGPIQTSESKTSLLMTNPKVAKREELLKTTDSCPETVVQPEEDPIETTESKASLSTAKPKVAKRKKSQVKLLKTTVSAGAVMTSEETPTSEALETSEKSIQDITLTVEIAKNTEMIENTTHSDEAVKIPENIQDALESKTKLTAAPQNKLVKNVFETPESKKQMDAETYHELSESADKRMKQTLTDVQSDEVIEKETPAKTEGLSKTKFEEEPTEVLIKSSLVMQREFSADKKNVKATVRTPEKTLESPGKSIQDTAQIVESEKTTEKVQNPSHKSVLKYLETPHNAETEETTEHLKETIHPTQGKQEKSQEKLLKDADSADTVRQSEEIPFQSSESKVSLSMAKPTATKRNKSQKKLLKTTDSADVVQGEEGAIQTSDSTVPLLSIKPMAAKWEESQEELLKTTDSVEIVFQPEECPIQTSESKASLSMAKPNVGKSQEELLKTTDGCAETVVQPEEDPIQTSESKTSLLTANPKVAKRKKSQEELLKTTDSCPETLVQPEEDPIETKESKASLLMAKREKSQEELLKTTDGCSEIVVQPEEDPLQTTESKSSLSAAKPKVAKRKKSQVKLLKTTFSAGAVMTSEETPTSEALETSEKAIQDITLTVEIAKNTEIIENTTHSAEAVKIPENIQDALESKTKLIPALQSKSVKNVFETPESKKQMDADTYHELSESADKRMKQTLTDVQSDEVIEKETLVKTEGLSKIKFEEEPTEVLIKSSLVMELRELSADKINLKSAVRTPEKTLESPENSIQDTAQTVESEKTTEIVENAAHTMESDNTTESIQDTAHTVHTSKNTEKIQGTLDSKTEVVVTKYPLMEGVFKTSAAKKEHDVEIYHPITEIVDKGMKRKSIDVSNNEIVKEIETNNELYLKSKSKKESTQVSKKPKLVMQVRRLSIDETNLKVTLQKSSEVTENSSKHLKKHFKKFRKSTETLTEIDDIVGGVEPARKAIIVAIMDKDSQTDDVHAAVEPEQSPKEKVYSVAIVNSVTVEPVDSLKEHLNETADLSLKKTSENINVDSVVEPVVELKRTDEISPEVLKNVEVSTVGPVVELKKTDEVSVGQSVTDSNKTDELSIGEPLLELKKINKVSIGEPAVNLKKTDEVSVGQSVTESKKTDDVSVDSKLTENDLGYTSAVEPIEQTENKEKELGSKISMSLDLSTKEVALTDAVIVVDKVDPAVPTIEPVICESNFEEQTPEFDLNNSQSTDATLEINQLTFEKAISDSNEKKIDQTIPLPNIKNPRRLAAKPGPKSRRRTFQKTASQKRPVVLIKRISYKWMLKQTSGVKTSKTSAKVLEMLAEKKVIKTSQSKRKRVSLDCIRNLSNSPVCLRTRSHSTEVTRRQSKQINHCLISKKTTAVTTLIEKTAETSTQPAEILESVKIKIDANPKDEVQRQLELSIKNILGNQLSETDVGNTAVSMAKILLTNQPQGFDSVPEDIFGNGDTNDNIETKFYPTILKPEDLMLKDTNTEEDDDKTNKADETMAAKLDDGSTDDGDSKQTSLEKSNSERENDETSASTSEGNAAPELELDPFAMSNIDINTNSSVFGENCIPHVIVRRQCLTDDIGQVIDELPFLTIDCMISGNYANNYYREPLYSLEPPLLFLEQEDEPMETVSPFDVLRQIPKGDVAESLNNSKNDVTPDEIDFETELLSFSSLVSIESRSNSYSPGSEKARHSGSTSTPGKDTVKGLITKAKSDESVFKKPNSVQMPTENSMSDIAQKSAITYFAPAVEVSTDVGFESYDELLADRSHYFPPTDAQKERKRNFSSSDTETDTEKETTPPPIAINVKESVIEVESEIKAGEPKTNDDDVVSGLERSCETVNTTPMVENVPESNTAESVSIKAKSSPDRKKLVEKSKINIIGTETIMSPYKLKSHAKPFWIKQLKSKSSIPQDSQVTTEPKVASTNSREVVSEIKVIPFESKSNDAANNSDFETETVGDTATPCTKANITNNDQTSTPNKDSMKGAQPRVILTKLPELGEVDNSANLIDSDLSSVQPPDKNSHVVLNLPQLDEIDDNINASENVLPPVEPSNGVVEKLPVPNLESDIPPFAPPKAVLKQPILAKIEGNNPELEPASKPSRKNLRVTCNLPDIVGIENNKDDLDKDLTPVKATKKNSRVFLKLLDLDDFSGGDEHTPEKKVLPVEPAKRNLQPVSKMFESDTKNNNKSELSPAEPPNKKPRVEVKLPELGEIDEKLLRSVEPSNTKPRLISKFFELDANDGNKRDSASAEPLKKKGRVMLQLPDLGDLPPVEQPNKKPHTKAVTRVSTDDLFDRLKRESPVNPLMQNPKPTLRKESSFDTDDNSSRDSASGLLISPGETNADAMSPVSFRSSTPPSVVIVPSMPLVSTPPILEKSPNITKSIDEPMQTIHKPLIRSTNATILLSPIAAPAEISKPSLKRHRPTDEKKAQMSPSESPEKSSPCRSPTPPISQLAKSGTIPHPVTLECTSKPSTAVSASVVVPPIVDDKPLHLVTEMPDRNKSKVEPMISNLVSPQSSKKIKSLDSTSSLSLSDTDSPSKSQKSIESISSLSSSTLVVDTVLCNQKSVEPVTISIEPSSSDGSSSAHKKLTHPPLKPSSKKDVASPAHSEQSVKIIPPAVKRSSSPSNVHSSAHSQKLIKLVSLPLKPSPSASHVRSPSPSQKPVKAIQPPLKPSSPASYVSLPSPSQKPVKPISSPLTRLPSVSDLSSPAHSQISTKLMSPLTKPSPPVSYVSSHSPSPKPSKVILPPLKPSPAASYISSPSPRQNTVKTIQTPPKRSPSVLDISSPAHSQKSSKLIPPPAKPSTPVSYLSSPSPSQKPSKHILPPPLKPSPSVSLVSSPSPSQKPSEPIPHSPYKPSPSVSFLSSPFPTHKPEKVIPSPFKLSSSRTDVGSPSLKRSVKPILTPPPVYSVYRNAYAPSPHRRTPSTPNATATYRPGHDTLVASLTAEIDSLSNYLKSLPQVDWTYADHKKRKEQIKLHQQKVKQLDELKNKPYEEKMQNHAIGSKSRSCSERQPIDGHSTHRPGAYSSQRESKEKERRRGYVNKFAGLKNKSFDSVERSEERTSKSRESKTLPSWDPRPASTEKIIADLHSLWRSK